VWAARGPWAVAMATAARKEGKIGWSSPHTHSLLHSHPEALGDPIFLITIRNKFMMAGPCVLEELCGGYSGRSETLVDMQPLD
jgi:hypothetical protein